MDRSYGALSRVSLTLGITAWAAVGPLIGGESAVAPAICMHLM